MLQGYKVQAQVVAYGVSPPRVRNRLLYDPLVKAFMDDEALEKWVVSMLSSKVSLQVTSLCVILRLGGKF